MDDSIRTRRPRFDDTGDDHGEAWPEEVVHEFDAMRLLALNAWLATGRLGVQAEPLARVYDEIGRLAASAECTARRVGAFGRHADAGIHGWPSTDGGLLEQAAQRIDLLAQGAVAEAGSLRTAGRASGMLESAVEMCRCARRAVETVARARNQARATEAAMGAVIAA